MADSVVERREGECEEHMTTVSSLNENLETEVRCVDCLKVITDRGTKREYSDG